MPEKRTIEKARQAKRKGKAPSSQAGEFVREEMHHIRQGKHGARSAKQAIAIGLSKARRAGVNLPPPEQGTVSEKTRKSAKRAYAAGRGSAQRQTSARRSRATQRALKKESRSAASRKALSRQARSSARKRTRAQRSASARRALRTKGPRGRSAAAKKAARTRRRGSRRSSSM
jgi:hypothetical protein